jgi:hypothetical protein
MKKQLLFTLFVLIIGQANPVSAQTTKPEPIVQSNSPANCDTPNRYGPRVRAWGYPGSFFPGSFFPGSYFPGSFYAGNGYAWGWGNPWIVPFGINNSYFWPGYLNTNQTFTPPLAPNPGAFSSSGGYGIGGGVYGPQKDLPVVVPRQAPRFATRDVKNHFNSIINNPQIGIQNAYRQQQWWRR